VGIASGKMAAVLDFSVIANSKCIVRTYWWFYVKTKPALCRIPG
jgi:hypothetical protein